MGEGAGEGAGLYALRVVSEIFLKSTAACLGGGSLAQSGTLGRLVVETADLDDMLPVCPATAPGITRVSLAPTQSAPPDAVWLLLLL